MPVEGTIAIENTVFGNDTWDTFRVIVGPAVLSRAVEIGSLP